MDLGGAEGSRLVVKGQRVLCFAKGDSEWTAECTAEWPDIYSPGRLLLELKDLEKKGVIGKLRNSKNSDFRIGAKGV